MPLLKLSSRQDSNTTQAFAGYAILSPQERVEILRRYKSGNLKVAQNYLKREDGRLFYEPWPDVEKSFEPYPGLSEATVRNITEFIRSRPLNLLSILYYGVTKGLKSPDESEREAAEILWQSFPSNIREIMGVGKMKLLIQKQFLMMGRNLTRFRRKSKHVRKNRQ